LGKIQKTPMKKGVFGVEYWKIVGVENGRWDMILVINFADHSSSLVLILLRVELDFQKQRVNNLKTT